MIWNDDKLREVIRDKASTKTECLLAEALLTQREISRALEAKIDPTLHAKLKDLEEQLDAANGRYDRAFSAAQKSELQVERLQNQIIGVRPFLEDLAEVCETKGTACVPECSGCKAKKLLEYIPGAYVEKPKQEMHLLQCPARSPGAGAPCTCPPINAAEKPSCGAPIPGGYCAFLKPCPDHETWMVTGPCCEHKRLGPDYMKPFWGPPVTPCPNCKYQKVLEEVRFGGVEKQKEDA